MHMPALFTSGSFLKGAEPRGRLPGSCFGNRDRRAANGKAGIMACVFVARVGQSNGGVSLRVRGQILISSLKEENTLCNNTGIK